MSSRIPEWAARYVSIPYEDMDCWRLVMAVYAAEFGIDIGDVHNQRKNMKDREWNDVIAEGMGFREGDVLLFKSSAVNRHVGILLTTELMLHSISGCNSCIERWESPIWRKRLVSIYRHRKSCNPNDS